MMSNSDNTRRWYDKDPVLSKAMKILETSEDKFQIQVAINLIKVIIEHNIENNTFSSIDDIISAVEKGRNPKGNDRWYDIDSTLRTAIQMLEDCPADMHGMIAHQIADMVTEQLKDTYDEDSIEDEECEEEEIL